MQFTHTIIPVVDNLFIGWSVAKAFAKRFEVDIDRESGYVISKKVTIKGHPTELHIVWVRNIVKIPSEVTNIFTTRNIRKSDKVGVILHGEKMAYKLLESYANTIDEETGAHVCVW